ISTRWRPRLAGRRCVGIERAMPRWERNVELLEQFLFALSMKERRLGAFNHWDVRASGLLCGPERKYGGGIDPLIAADRGDAEQIDLRRSEQHQQREEVGSLRAGAVLAGNHFDFFLCGGGVLLSRSCRDR